MFPVEHQVKSSCLQAQVPTLGHWNPEVGKLGTLEPRSLSAVKRTTFSGDPNWVKETPDEEQVHRPSVFDVSRSRAPTEELVQGHRPKERPSVVRCPLGSPASLHCVVHGQAAHGGYVVLGGCTLVAGTVFDLSFPEALMRGAVPQFQSG